MLDLIIIGAGPAGLSACLYASRAGLDVLIFDSAAPGGKLNVTAQIENYPGLKPTPGPEIAFTMYESRSEERRVGKECRSRWSPYH